MNGERVNQLEITLGHIAKRKRKRRAIVKQSGRVGAHEPFATSQYDPIRACRHTLLLCYGKSVEKEEKEKLLFQNDLLNKSVILKRYEPGMPTDSHPVMVNTIVYFPAT